MTIADIDKMFDLFSAVGRLKIVEVSGVSVGGEMEFGSRGQLEISAILEVNSDSIVVFLPAWSA